MRSEADIEERLNVLMQAYYFMDRRAGEQSDEVRVKLRVLEGQIETIQWCLEDGEQSRGSPWKRFWGRMWDTLDRRRGPRAKDRNL